MDEPHYIHSLLHHLSAIFARESDQILQEQLGLTFSQYKILITLRDNSLAQQRQIALNLGQTEASISRQVKALQRKNYLESKINPRNHRQHQIRLTTKGTRITEAAQSVLRGFERGTLTHMPSKQQAQLLELLASIHR